MIHTHDNNHDLEERGFTELQLVGVRYTGDRSVVMKSDLADRGGWQGPTRFQRGQTQLGLVPDWSDSDEIADSNRRVTAIENMGDFEVIYDPETIAQVLLDKNYLPVNVFRSGYDNYVREALFDRLGLEEQGRVDNRDDEEKYREQLRDIAGVESREEEYIEKTRIEEYDKRFSREQLSALIKTLRESTEDFDLRGAGRVDMLQYLATYDKEEIENTIRELKES
jgi:hypothetical protein